MSMYDYLTRDDMGDLRDFQKLIIKTGAVRLDTRAVDDHGVLVSYWTRVARIEDGKLVRMWNDWSATTAKHVKLFCQRYGLPYPNKAEWCKMEVKS